MYESLSGVLNLELGLEYCGGMEDLFGDMLNDYLEADRVAELNGYFDAKDWTNYRVCVHGIKSTTLMIGGETLSAKCKELELAAADNNESYIVANHAAVMDEYAQLLDKIREAI